MSISTLKQLYKKAPTNAAQNPCTSNPFTKLLTNQNNTPLITKVKSPRVTIVTGNVNRINTGRIIVFTTESNTTANNAAYTPETAIEDTQKSTSNKAHVSNSHRINNCIDNTNRIIAGYYTKNILKKQ